MSSKPTTGPYDYPRTSTTVSPRTSKALKSRDSKQSQATRNLIHPTEKHPLQRQPTNHYQDAVAAAGSQTASGFSSSETASPTKDDQKRERHENLLASAPAPGYHSTEQ